MTVVLFICFKSLLQRHTNVIDEIKGFADDVNRLREQSKLMESIEMAAEVTLTKISNNNQFFPCQSPASTRKFSRQKSTHAYDAFASYIREEGHLYDLYEVFLVLTKARRDADFRQNVPFIREVCVSFSLL